MSDETQPAGTPPPAPAVPKPPGLAVELPGNLEPVYSNTAIITHSASEIIVDFARVMPNVPKAKVYARVVMTPMNAKLLLRALGENLSKFEGTYGEIKLPEGFSLADHLFKPPSKPSE
ncbi:MAG: DUF3467 domain-containing protein [Chloroflexi bacterium]|nr:DUF3467 domain-containing protein [Chloroflexota bacterium]